MCCFLCCLANCCTAGTAWDVGAVTLLLVTMCKIRGLICFLSTLKGAEMDLVVIFPLYV